MKEVVAYLVKEDLIKSIGKDYQEALNTLLKEGLINSYQDVIEVKLDKDKAIHFQSALAFHDVKDVPNIPIRHFKKEE